jgi:uncharacterized SAM-binding protein YcdF (DUF218 family)
VRDEGAIERPDGTEPTGEPPREPPGAGLTRRDLRRRVGSRTGLDPTQQDPPGPPRGRAADGRTLGGEQTVGLARPGPPAAGSGTGARDGEGPGPATEPLRDGRIDGSGDDRFDPPRARYDAGAGTAPRRRRRWAWRTAALLLLIVIGIPLFVAFRVWYVAREDDRRHSDAIIVLGAAQYNGRPSPVLEWRLLHALKLYREGVAPHIVTVGGNRPGDHYTEAGTGKTWLHEHGVPDDRIVAVGSGSDTLQSMIDVGRVYRRLGWHTGVIVTDPPHALRSRTMARDNGIDAVTSPTRSGPTVGSRDTEFNYIVRETGGYLYYEFIGRWHAGT